MKKLLLKLKNKKGFTLVESIVSIAILAIASLAFATFLATSNKLTVNTILNDHDRSVLQEAIASGDYAGLEVVGYTEEGKSFTIVFDENTKVEIKGKYVIVTNPATGRHYVIFVGDNTLKDEQNETP